ncbi:MAG: hypothetical protein ACAH59_10190, partial [Pseudobdellovibrionaceae bacterium]
RNNFQRKNKKQKPNLPNELSQIHFPDDHDGRLEAFARTDTLPFTLGTAVLETLHPRCCPLVRYTKGQYRGWVPTAKSFPQSGVRSSCIRLIVNIHVSCLTPSGLAFGEFPENLCSSTDFAEQHHGGVVVFHLDGDY